MTATLTAAVSAQPREQARPGTGGWVVVGALHHRGFSRGPATVVTPERLGDCAGTSRNPAPTRKQAHGSGRRVRR